MKIQPQQLTQHLTDKIAPLYLISGDELFLIQETREVIRKHAVAIGYNDREIFYIETGFNWDRFLISINNLSLFDSKTLVELHIKSKITEMGNKILQNYAKNPAPNKIVLIISDKLDAPQQRTAWFKAIDTYGVIIPIWPIDIAQLPMWINKRLQQVGLKADEHVIKLITDYSSGNLLAASQEIEKLHLLYGNCNLTAEQIMSVITDNARFNIFSLLDNALSGKAALLTRMLDNVKNEGTEPTILLWSLARELRLLINISDAVKHGTSIDQTMTQYNIWNNRKTLVKKALSRLNLTLLKNLLKHLSLIDGIIKGANNQRLLWHELHRLYFDIATTSSTK